MIVPASQLTKKDFQTNQEVRWCPGCGDYAVLAQMQKIMPELGIARENIVFISGIGCSSRFPYYMNTYGFHSIHGRAPAIATGLKLARPELSVWVVTGDGDGLSIGGNHLIHALRRNIDIKILLFNNRIYGLTKGQYSPTSELGTRAKSTPLGSVDQPLNPLSIALAAGATFVARSVDTEGAHLQEILRRAAHHRGSALVEIFQNCNVFNDGAFAPVTDRATKADRQLRLAHGQPLMFGGETKKAVTLGASLTPQVVELTNQGEAADHLPVHDETRADPSWAFFLSRLDYPQFPVPLGVLRAVERATYDDLIEGQGEEARRHRGEGRLEQLLNSGDAWDVS